MIGDKNKKQTNEEEFLGIVYCFNENIKFEQLLNGLKKGNNKHLCIVKAN